MAPPIAIGLGALLGIGSMFAAKSIMGEAAPTQAAAPPTVPDATPPPAAPAAPPAAPPAKPGTESSFLSGVTGLPPPPSVGAPTGQKTLLGM